MNYKITKASKSLTGSVNLTASKSESNRVLIIQALCNDSFFIKNLALAEDTRILSDFLKAEKEGSHFFNVGAAGTTMRFLTAFFSTRPGTRILTGSDRMKKRPIGILVDALRTLGADIEYMEKEGFAPLRIRGTQLKGTEIEMNGSVSSQYISALLLISSEISDELIIKFKNEPTSKPYIDMTLSIMKEFRVESEWKENKIIVKQQKYERKKNKEYSIEADWSSASYWYAIAALSDEVNFTIKGLKERSLQGDSSLVNMFFDLGIKTDYVDNGVLLTKKAIEKIDKIYDFQKCPDLAQTISIVTSGLRLKSSLKGLHTLRIKETDRIEALRNELQKLNVSVVVNGDNIELTSDNFKYDGTLIKTYEDHRMAMAFSVASTITEFILIEDAEVVKKSYPDFWKDLQSNGFEIKKY